MIVPAVAAPVAYSRLPTDVAGWVVWGAVAVTCAWVLWKSVQWTIWPGEDAPDHVKRSILDDDLPRAPAGDAPPPPNGPPDPLLSSAASRSAAPKAPA